MAQYDESWINLGISEKEWNEVIKRSITDVDDAWKKIVVEPRKNTRCRKTDYVWLTVNPKPDVNFAEFMALVDQFVKLKPLDAYCYVYEQRSSNDAEKGKGFHTHMLIRRHGKPFLLVNAIHRVFDRVVGIPDKHIVISWIERHQLDEKMEYLRGNKSGRDKIVKSSVDERWRAELGLDPIYVHNSSVFTC